MAKRYVVEVYTDLGLQSRWRLVAPNGQVIAASGEGYTKAEHADKMVDQIFDGMYPVRHVEAGQ